MKLRRHRTFAVVGLGTFGSTIALELERLGGQVLGIDRSEERVRAVVDQLSHAIIADARDERALSDAGMADYDVAVVAIGEDLESSILCTIALKSLGVGCVWAKALSGTHARMLKQLGADRIVEPEREIGLQVAQSLTTPNVIDYIGLGSSYYVVEVNVPEPLVGRAISELRLGTEFAVRFLGLMRGPIYISGENEDPILQDKDRLILLGKRDELRRLGEDL